MTQPQLRGHPPAQTGRAHAPDDVRVLPVLPFALLPLAVHHGRVHVGWGKRVGLIQQRDHAQEDGPGNQTGAGKNRSESELPPASVSLCGCIPGLGDLALAPVRADPAQPSSLESAGPGCAAPTRLQLLSKAAARVPFATSGHPHVPAVPPTRSSTHRTFCVGFQRSDGSSPLCGSSTGGCRMEMQTSPV